MYGQKIILCAAGPPGGRRPGRWQLYATVVANVGSTESQLGCHTQRSYFVALKHDSLTTLKVQYVNSLLIYAANLLCN